MSDGENKGSERGFKVEDRRRFSESGEPRPTADAPAEAPAPPEAAPGGGTAPRSAGGATETHALEVSFSTFVISLVTQALAHLGEIPDPVDHNTVVDLGAARQLIDILGMLRDKTTGNLDSAEGALLDHALYDLRLKYVEHARLRNEAG
jgi:Domain of unknown function (DUF1844)